jgi:DeoR family transcriptional regulator, suf operon transcriptional repressor
MATTLNEDKTELTGGLSDRDVIEFIRSRGSVTVAELVEFSGVTATAVRQRITRLAHKQLVRKDAESAGRGRPTHRYSLSREGIRSCGTNYEDLVRVLWNEIREVEDPDLRYTLLRGIVSRLADLYRDKVEGKDLAERLQSLVSLMGDRQVPFEVTQENGSPLPVLSALACPYPGLSEQDRTVCSMERMLFSEILGGNLKMTSCRLDGGNHCTFDVTDPTVRIA